jgi:hypothetical protein
MAAYRFRVSFEDYDDVVRDIEIKSTQTFEEFHHAIHNCIGFDAAKPASFYISNDNWKKGKEITSRELKEAEKDTVATMRTARLRDFIADPHQKIYYIFDFTANWAFRIELIKIIVADDNSVTYPRCIKSMGEAPKQYGNIITGPLPQPDDFEEGEEEVMVEEEAMDGPEEGIEADEVPIAIDTEEGAVDIDEDGAVDDEVIDEEPKDNDEF